MVLKKPLTFEEQVLKLEEHGMNISDREIAIDILKRINYYKLTGYALHYKRGFFKVPFSIEVLIK